MDEEYTHHKTYNTTDNSSTLTRQLRAITKGIQYNGYRVVLLQGTLPNVITNLKQK